jgi:hypothetical protein
MVEPELCELEDWLACRSISPLTSKARKNRRELRAGHDRSSDLQALVEFLLAVASRFTT